MSDCHRWLFWLPLFSKWSGQFQEVNVYACEGSALLSRGGNSLALLSHVGCKVSIIQKHVLHRDILSNLFHLTIVSVYVHVKGEFMTCHFPFRCGT